LVSGKRWTTRKATAGEYQASGTFYEVAAIRLPCRGSGGAGALAILATFHHTPKGFRCTIASGGGGECSAGSRTRPKGFTFFIETNCATPAPPYTPYSMLPASCRDFAGS
jgi:hypothetical protein